MAENLIATTSKISMHALAWQGIPVYTCYLQIYETVERKFGREVALLYARPVENQAVGEIDWYTPVSGTARRLADLPEEEKKPIYEKFAAAAEEILKYADEELIRSGKPQRITRGEILKLSLRYPDDNALLVVGEQPVMTCWGFGPGTPGVEGQYLARLFYQPKVAEMSSQDRGKPLAETPPPEKGEIDAVPVKKERRTIGWDWLWWLFPLACLCLLFLLLFTSFGSMPAISGIPLFEWQGFPLEKQQKDYTAELGSLKMELGELDQKLREHLAQCVPAKKGESAPRAEEALVIPENANNMDFLEGEWLCRTGLANKQTGDPVQFSFTFNREGKGAGTVHEAGGEECTGNAAGTLQNGVLSITLGEQKCASSERAYMPINIECRNISRSTGTSCAGINSDGTRWEASFNRVR